MWFDLRYGLRRLVKTPGFSVLTLTVLMAGLAVSIYMFVLLRTFAFADMPYADQERFVALGLVRHGTEEGGNSINGFDFLEFQKANETFEYIIPLRQVTLALNSGRDSQLFSTKYTTPQMFELTAVAPIMGRTLSSTDMAPGAARVVVISHEVWQNTFSNDESIIGKVIKLDDQATTVIGVMPMGYRFPDDAHLWMPIQFPSIVEPGDGPYMYPIGKLKKGVSVSAANKDLQAIAKRLEEQYAATNKGKSIRVWSFTQRNMTNTMPLIAVMIASSIAIMLLVMLNAGNLLFVRAVEQQKELAIRSALGAPRWRLIGQMLSESLILTSFATLIALFFASWALQITERALVQFALAQVPFWWSFKIDSNALLFSFFLSISTTLLIGLYPAIRACNHNLSQFLRDGTRGAQSMQLGAITRWIITTEIGLSIGLVLLSLALVSSLNNIRAADNGANTHQKLTAEVYLFTQNYQDPAKLDKFHEKLQQSIAQKPGVESVSLGCHLPGMYGPIWTYLVEGTDVPDGNYPSATRVIITDNYFDTFSIPLINGRKFDSRDHAQTERVVIISEAMAQKNWPNENPIGKRIGLARDHDPNNEKWHTVIGVVGEVVYGQPQVSYAHLPDIYLSIRQHQLSEPLVAIKTSMEPSSFSRTLSDIVAEIDSDIPVHHMQTLDERLARLNGGLSFISFLFMSFAVLAMLLAASGIYGVIARAVALRTQELGLRRALGSPDTSILWMLLRGTGWQFGFGSFIGLVVGPLLITAIASMLYQMEHQIWWMATMVVALIGLIAFVATYIPTKRALKMTPADALRYE